MNRPLPRRLPRIPLLLSLLALLGGLGAAAAPGSAERGERPFLRSGLVFAPDALHNHSSSVVEAPNGDLLVCWYRGSGERRADDVAVLGARRSRATGKWSEPFVMADIPGFPDCNPCMLVDPRGRLWLFWVTIQANEWHTALLRYKVSESFHRPGPPRWSQEKVLHLKPGEEFTRVVHAAVDADLQNLHRFPAELRERVREYLELRRKNAADKYFMRLGWMPRAHPVVLDGRRLILPLYSDGFDFSLMAYTDDWGESWSTNLPLVGDGPVQPTIARRRDGTLATYMRDNGTPPKRLLYSESTDRGETWTPVRDSEIHNPGAGAEVINLRNGMWALINNDTERGRHRLAVSLSADEGKTWRWTRYLERDDSPQGGGSFSYPSLIQAEDGTLHATYSYVVPEREQGRDAQGRPLRESIKHAHFNIAWVQAGP